MPSGRGRRGVVYANPNIDPQLEYVRRRDAMLEYADMVGARVVEMALRSVRMASSSRGTRGRPTCPMRRCYRLRLGTTAAWAFEQGIERFATTLTVSPYQDPESIRLAGEEVASANALSYVHRDFRDRYPSATSEHATIGCTARTTAAVPTPDARRKMLASGGAQSDKPRGRANEAGTQTGTSRSRRSMSERSRGPADRRLRLRVAQWRDRSGTGEPRDSCRLLVLDRESGEIDHCRFTDLPGLLGPGDLLVVNETRVIPARLKGEKAETGAIVEVLLLRERYDDTWECLVRPGRRLPPGAHVVFGGGELTGFVVDTVDETGGGSSSSLRPEGPSSTPCTVWERCRCLLTSRGL